MPTLNWIGKGAVCKHHKEVPFRMLGPVEELACGNAENDDNLMISGRQFAGLRHCFTLRWTG